MCVCVCVCVCVFGAVLSQPPPSSVLHRAAVRTTWVSPFTATRTRWGTNMVTPRAVSSRPVSQLAVALAKDPFKLESDRNRVSA